MLIFPLTFVIAINSSYSLSDRASSWWICLSYKTFSNSDISITQSLRRPHNWNSPPNLYCIPSNMVPLWAAILIAIGAIAFALIIILSCRYNKLCICLPSQFNRLTCNIFVNFQLQIPHDFIVDSNVCTSISENFRYCPTQCSLLIRANHYFRIHKNRIAALNR